MFKCSTNGCGRLIGRPGKCKNCVSCDNRAKKIQEKLQAVIGANLEYDYRTQLWSAWVFNTDYDLSATGTDNEKAIIGLCAKLKKAGFIGAIEFDGQFCGCYPVLENC